MKGYSAVPYGINTTPEYAARIRDPLRETGYRSQSLFAPQGFLPSCSHLIEEFTKDDTEHNELLVYRCHIATLL